jgi:preprotein translocase subunit SecF
MNWLKYSTLYFIISLLVIIPGTYSLIRYGLNLSIDFTGGSVVEIQTEPKDSTKLLDLVKKDYSSAIKIQDTPTIKLELPSITQDDLNKLTSKLSPDFKEVKIISFNTVGPSIGRQLLIKTLTALALATILILSYVAYAFKDIKYGLAAIIAMLHDTLVLIGTFSLLGHYLYVKTDPLFVTAMLTTLSFSVHDTIIVFDRIRELSRRTKAMPFKELANHALDQTIVRSINNSLTVIFMLLAIVFLGGESVHWFAVALLVGSISGAYSSPFNAVPLLVIFNKMKRKRK